MAASIANFHLTVESAVKKKKKKKKEGERERERERERGVEEP